MKFKDIILEIIRDYYRKRAIIRDVVISEQKGVRTVNVFDNLAANKWKLFNQDKTTPNTQLANTIIEGEKRVMAKQLFRIAERVLESMGKME